MSLVCNSMLPSHLPLYLHLGLLKPYHGPDTTAPLWLILQ